MGDKPQVDVNLFVYNGARTVGAAIESVLAQTWPSVRLTLIDDGSSDGTTNFLARLTASDSRIVLKRNRRNGGAVANFQRAFWFGDADFVMPKSGDDILAPDFIEKTMEVLLNYPDCAMCHAGGLIFTGEAQVRGLYPIGHCLEAVGEDRVARACHVMARYTSSPSFWGVYRRDAVDQLARIRHRAGWDHALLAELALYGEIRHVPLPLYWRRDCGKPVLDLARASTERGSRGLDVDDPCTEPHWRMPLTMTALSHLETFSVARIDAAERGILFRAVPETFRARWLPAMKREAGALRTMGPTLLAQACEAPKEERNWMLRNLADLLYAARLIVPEEDFPDIYLALDALRRGSSPIEEAA